MRERCVFIKVIGEGLFKRGVFGEEFDGNGLVKHVNT